MMHLMNGNLVHRSTRFPKDALPLGGRPSFGRTVTIIRDKKNLWLARAADVTVCDLSTLFVRRRVQLKELSIGS
jgi:hypothetical protein